MATHQQQHHHHTDETSLTHEEAIQYDRQIRFWGLDAQQRMKKTCVLLVGVNAINLEVTKNLALAGVPLCVIDDRTPLPIDYEFNYCLDATLSDPPSVATQVVKEMREMNSHGKFIVEKDFTKSMIEANDVQVGEQGTCSSVIGSTCVHPPHTEGRPSLDVESSALMKFHIYMYIIYDIIAMC
eukprot:GHVU01030166.1.p1 GENE.GHVU01030166.1~~GHVU01030166.1.p1  ORF type:complete len:183 (-),score=32.10 GHVU01030166.1:336-884(-)